MEGKTVMSWCRWSTDIDGDRQSDLYIYESVSDCITVHIAGRRRSNYGQCPYPYKGIDVEEYLKVKDDPEALQSWAESGVEYDKLRNDWLDKNIVWQDLPEEYAGKTFDFGYDDLVALKLFLDQCEIDGINFPKYVFDYVQELVENNNEL